MAPDDKPDPDETQPPADTVDPAAIADSLVFAAPPSEQEGRALLADLPRDATILPPGVLA